MNNMGNNKLSLLVQGIFCISMVVFLASCKTTNNLGVFDASVPSDRQCTLLIQGSVSIRTIDDKNVKWYKGVFQSNKTHQVMIPAGKHSFTAYAEYIQRYRVISFTYDFEAGKSYRIVAEGPYPNVNIRVTLYTGGTLDWRN